MILDLDVVPTIHHRLIERSGGTHGVLSQGLRSLPYLALIIRSMESTYTQPSSRKPVGRDMQ